MKQYWWRRKKAQTHKGGAAHKQEVYLTANKEILWEVGLQAMEMEVVQTPPSRPAEESHWGVVLLVLVDSKGILRETK